MARCVWEQARSPRRLVPLPRARPASRSARTLLPLVCPADTLARYVPARQQLFVVTPKKTVTLKGELHTEPLDSIRLAFYCGRVGADEDEVHLSARPPTRPKRAFHPHPKS